MKFALVRYIRYAALLDGKVDVSAEVKFLFSDLFRFLNVEDLTTLKMVLPLLGQDDLADRVESLLPLSQTTINSKF